MTPGRAYCISGSSEVFGLIADRAAPAEGLITLPWGAGMWQIGGPGQNGANALAFIVDRLAPGEAPFADRLAALLAQPVSPEPLLFLPFLHGERVPHWDADLRAAFVGLSASHGPGDMVRAVMEGVAFVNRTVLGRAEAATGCRADEVRIAGGGALSDTWSQIRADVLGRPVRTFGGREMGLAGAFAIARVGLGLAPSLAAAADRSGDSTLFAPSPEAMRRADALFPLFGKAHDRLADLSRRLARFDDAR
nr:FGGY-family carbohydrate kinase [Acuticoccus mangrovi]